MKIPITILDIPEFIGTEVSFRRSVPIIFTFYLIFCFPFGSAEAVDQTVNTNLASSSLTQIEQETTPLLDDPTTKDKTSFDLSAGFKKNLLPKFGQESRAIKVAQKGYVDTDLSFNEFFSGPHTIMAWVMPEYVHNYYGPIFAESGGGYFVVGQGDYRSGNGGRKKAGDPVLYETFARGRQHNLVE